MVARVGYEQHAAGEHARNRTGQREGGRLGEAPVGVARAIVHLSHQAASGGREHGGGFRRPTNRSWENARSGCCRYPQRTKIANGEHAFGRAVRIARHGAQAGVVNRIRLAGNQRGHTHDARRGLAAGKRRQVHQQAIQIVANEQASGLVQRQAGGGSQTGLGLPVAVEYLGGLNIERGLAQHDIRRRLVRSGIEQGHGVSQDTVVRGIGCVQIPRAIEGQAAAVQVAAAQIQRESLRRGQAQALIGRVGVERSLADDHIRQQGVGGLLEGLREAQDTVVSGIDHVEVALAVHGRAGGRTHARGEGCAGAPSTCRILTGLPDDQIRQGAVRESGRVAPRQDAVIPRVDDVEDGWSNAGIRRHALRGVEFTSFHQVGRGCQQGELWLTHNARWARIERGVGVEQADGSRRNQDDSGKL